MDRPFYYLLGKNKETIPLSTSTPESARLWSAMFESSDRIVAKTKAWFDVEVSTVFLGLDHAFGSGPPMLFETMVFGGKYSDEQWRYSTWDEALEGHWKAVAMVRPFWLRPPAVWLRWLYLVGVKLRILGYKRPLRARRVNEKA